MKFKLLFCCIPVLAYLILILVGRVFVVEWGAFVISLDAGTFQVARYERIPARDLAFQSESVEFSEVAWRWGPSMKRFPIMRASLLQSPVYLLVVMACAAALGMCSAVEKWYAYRKSGASRAK